MIRFRCSYQWDEDERDDWDGVITYINNYGNHYEILITHPSNIRLIVGKWAYGLYACIPTGNAGCYLGKLDDTFHNSDRLIYALEDPVEGTTVACALKAVADILEFH
jgi:hypothetical protein